jgi:ABC-type transport system involved in cytochrome c biogenesis ATPase subunit
MTPPNNVPAERHLLGVLLRDALPLPSDLKPSDFFEPVHQDIYAAALSLAVDGIRADEHTVTQKLREVKSKVEAATVSLLVSDSGFGEYRQEHVDLITSAALLREAAIAVANATDPDTLLEHYARLSEGRKGRKVKVGPARMDFDALMSFKRKEDPTCILGSNRWLCKGGSMLIVGQSGTGKSSLMMQAAVLWCMGRDFFGIKPVKALRAVVLQAENDAGDISEALQDVIAGAYLDSEEKATLRDHLAIFRDTVSTGTTFTAALRQLIIDQRADIVFIDPLLSFAGIDVSDQEQASKFLRHDLAPILLETGAVLVAMHHTGKPKAASDKEGHTVADLAYAGLGSSEFTNWFREVAVLFRCQGEEPIYKFGLTKRRGRAGLKDSTGQFKAEINIRHSSDKEVIRWEYAHTPPEVSQQDAVYSPAKGSSSQSPAF